MVCQQCLSRSRSCSCSHSDIVVVTVIVVRLTVIVAEDQQKWQPQLGCTIGHESQLASGPGKQVK